MKEKRINVDKVVLLAGLSGAAVAFIIELVLTVILALCLNEGITAVQSVTYVVPVIQFAGAAVGMLLARGKGLRETPVVCAITGIAVIILKICITALFFDGISVATAISVLPILLAWLLIVLSAFRKKNTYKAKRRGRPHR